MLPLGDLLDHLAIKRREIIRLAAGHQSVIDHDFTIDPFRAGVFQVGLNRLVAGHLAPFDDAGVDQRPWAMANRGDGLAGVEECADEVERLRVAAKLVRIHHAAGQNQRIEVVRICLGEREIDGELIPPLGVLPTFDLSPTILLRFPLL